MMVALKISYDKIITSRSIYIFIYSPDIINKPSEIRYGIDCMKYSFHSIISLSA